MHDTKNAKILTIFICKTNRHNFIKISFTFEETNILSDIRNLKFK